MVQVDTVTVRTGASIVMEKAAGIADLSSRLMLKKIQS
jgi:hypothetical protein